MFCAHFGIIYCNAFLNLKYLKSQGSVDRHFFPLFGNIWRVSLMNVPSRIPVELLRKKKKKKKKSSRVSGRRNLDMQLGDDTVRGSWDK